MRQHAGQDSCRPPHGCTLFRRKTACRLSFTCLRRRSFGIVSRKQLTGRNSRTIPVLFLAPSSPQFHMLQNRASAPRGRHSALSRAIVCTSPRDWYHSSCFRRRSGIRCGQGVRRPLLERHRATRCAGTLLALPARGLRGAKSCASRHRPVRTGFPRRSPAHLRGRNDLS